MIGFILGRASCPSCDCVLLLLLLFQRDRVCRHSPGRRVAVRVIVTVNAAIILLHDSSRKLSQSPTILGMTNSITAVMMLCVVFRLVKWMWCDWYQWECDVIWCGGCWCSCVLVRTDTETEMATDALIDGHPAGGLIIALRSLWCAQFCHLHPWLSCWWRCCWRHGYGFVRPVGVLYRLVGLMDGRTAPFFFPDDVKKKTHWTLQYFSLLYVFYVNSIQFNSFIHHRSISIQIIIVKFLALARDYF